MPKRESKREESIQGQTPQKYVVSESEIRDFVGSLGVLDISTVAARFQVVADLTGGAFEESKDQLGKSDLALIKRIADEDNSAPYRLLMKAVIAGVGQGRHGINAAHLTARRVVELSFRCTREYFSALHDYSRNLRLRLLDRTSHATHAVRRSRGW
jgi:hypothetical protein